MQLADHVVQAIQAVLRERKISGSELARRLGVSQPYISRRMSGRTPFDVDDLEQIAAALDVPVDRLLPTGKSAA